MRIAIIGGLERSESTFERMAEAAGQSVEFHRGHMGGRGSGNLGSLIARSDVVIVVTDVNSHGAVQQARKLVRQRSGAALLLMRRLSVACFADLLGRLSRGLEPVLAGGARAS